MRILVVEDDALTVNALTTILGQQTYAVEQATDGEAAWMLIDSFAFDLVVLDVGIPKLNGLELCRRVRSQGYQMPILLLTARDSGHDKAVGLDAGADDYVVKPFDPEELVARVRALLRRGNQTTQPILTWGDLHLDPSSCQVTYAQQPVSLTPKEYALLELFLRHRQRVFSCAVILEQIWTFDELPGEEAVRTHIKGLRQKLKAAHVPTDLIETVYGMGYRLKPETEALAPNPQADPNQAASSASPEPAPQAQALAAIAQIWQRHQPRVVEQVAVIDQAVQQWMAHRLTPELQQQAQQEAHTLAGSLGTFGRAHGSQLARTIEQLLQRQHLPKREVKQLQQLVADLRAAIADPPPAAPDTPVPDTPVPDTTVDTVAVSLQTKAPIAATILAVDDDPAIAAILRSLLTPWGLEVVTLSDPRQFWPTLETTAPDLLILDLRMPHHNGIELCQAIRDSDRWCALPIMVLTAATDATTVSTVFAAGADDFVGKPIVGPELVTRIINRLERMRLLRHLGQRTSSPPASTWNQSDLFCDRSQDLLCSIGFDGSFQQVNPAFGQTLGEPAAWLGTPYLDRVHPDDQEHTRAQLQHLYQGQAVDFENRYRAADGSYHWLTWRFTPIAESDLAYAIARDITAQKLQEAAWRKSRNEIELRVAERTAELVSLNQRLQHELDVARHLQEERDRVEIALRESQTRLAGILEIADDAIISINASQQITLYNQGAEKIFGYNAQEVVGQPLDLLLPAASAAVHRQHVANFGQSNGQARRMGERKPIFGRRKDGSEFPAEASISCFTMSGERIFTVILRDITERNNIDRMKDEFVSVVSHELRTPLTSIHGSLRMLVSGLLSAESERGKRLLQIAADSTDRLVRLINDILDIERIESGKVTMHKSDCNVADLITGAANEMQGILDKANITLAVTSQSIPIEADRDRIIQTLTNLLSNAVKFSPSGSTIDLSAELITAPPIAPDNPTPIPHVRFTVRDQGRGIPADKLEAIFERFQQVDASDSRHQDGTGLGLAICRSIVEQHYGHIWVNSQLGQGSTFFFTVPVSAP